MLMLVVMNYLVSVCWLFLLLIVLRVMWVVGFVCSMCVYIVIMCEFSLFRWLKLL